MIDRSLLFNTISELELVERYRRNYGLGQEIGLQEVRQHAQLEGELTDALLRSTPVDRASVFSNAYSRLYSELPWLSGTGTSSGADNWARLFRPNSSIYEIGSGAGYIIKKLAERGFDCTMTDISAERGASSRAEQPNLTRAVTDGVHLSRFVAPGSFDYVISNQVVEHLHPDDLITHFTEARAILKPGGEYIFATPYAPFGPADLSLVFGLDRPVFMHLHEMNYADVSRVARAAGYAAVSAILTIDKLNLAVKSRFYYQYIRVMDRFMTNRNKALAKLLIRRGRLLKLSGNIFVSMVK